MARAKKELFQIRLSPGHAAIVRDLIDRRQTTRTAFFESLIDREATWEIDRQRMIDRAAARKERNEMVSEFTKKTQNLRQYRVTCKHWNNDMDLPAFTPRMLTLIEDSHEEPGEEVDIITIDAYDGIESMLENNDNDRIIEWEDITESEDME